jgi:uncharacterized protein YndB with AHSA1/START domain
MATVTCPTDLVRAPARRIWDLLTIPSELETWSGARVVRGPRRRLTAGDELVLATGVGGSFQVRFHVTRADPPEELALEIRLPLGILNHEVVRITPAGADGCRVTYN